MALGSPKRHFQSMFFLVENISGETEMNDNTDDAMRALGDFLSAQYEEHTRTIDELSRTLGVSRSCANDVMYLRTRSRWTEELEAELIRLHKDGTPPNVMEFGSIHAIAD